MTRFPLPRFGLLAGVMWVACLCGSAYGQLSVSWFHQFGLSAECGEASRVDAAADGVYVAGDVGCISQSAYVSKFDLNGNELWRSQVDVPANAYPLGVSAAADGVYVAGGFWQNNMGLPSAFVSKYDSNGNELWTRQFVSVNTWINAASAATDGVYVGGYSIGALPGPAQPNNGSAFMRKYDPNGNILWTIQFGLPFANDYVSAVNALGVAAEGVYAVGYTADASGNYNGFVNEYDFDGNLLWTKSAGALGGDVSVTADSVYVTGLMGAGNNQFVSKYTLNGNELWTSQLSPLPMPCTCSDLRVTATASDVFVLSQSRSSVSEFNPNGNLVDVTEVADPNLPPNSNVSANDIGATTGGVYVAGILFEGVAKLDGFLAMLTSAPQPGPVSRVSPLPAAEFSTSFTVQWSGTDNGGPGIQDYTIYVSDNGGPFTTWLTKTTATQATFTGVNGHTYGFYSIAQDLAGNVESPKSAAEASTFVDATRPVSHVSALPGTTVSPNFLVQWSGTDIGGPGIGKYNIYVSDNGSAFKLWQTSTTATQAWYVGYLGHTYGFFSQATDIDGSQENLKSAADAMTQTPPIGLPEDVNGDGLINCLDIAIVEAALGSTPGQPNWNPAADVNKDGVVNVKDLALVAQMLVPGTKCN